MQIMRRSKAGLAGLATLLLSACALNPFAVDSDRQAGFLAGPNLVGESCRAVPNGPERQAMAASKVFDIQCGQWEAPSAQLAVYEDVALAPGTEPPVWGERLAETAACGAPEETDWKGGSAVDFSCRLRGESAFPYEARLLRRGDRIFAIQGIPAAMLPATFAAEILGDVSDKRDIPDASRVDQTRLDYESRIGARVFSVGDVFSFLEVMDYARYLNAQGLHPDALIQYQKALSMQQRFLPGDDPRLADVLMVLALENSNLRRFEQANSQFIRAERLVRNAIDPNARARLVSYQAFHQANQREFSKALETARRASNQRQRIVETYLKGGLPDPTGEFSEALSSTGDLGTSYGLTALADLLQSRYLEGAMLRTLGRGNEALAVANEAQAAVARYPSLAIEWQQQLRLLKAELAEDAGRLGEARAILAQIIAEEQKRSVDSHLAAVTLIERGRLAFADDDRTAGFEDTEAGLAMIQRSQQDLPIEALTPFYDAVLVERAGSFSPALLARTFAYSQLTRSTIVAQTMRQSFARLATEDSAGGQAIRDLQDLRRYRDDLTEALSIAQSRGDTLEAEQLRRTFAATDRQITVREQAVQSALPRYNLLIDAPVALDTLQASLRDGEGTLVFQVSPERSYAFLVTKDDLAFYGIDATEKDLNNLIRAVRVAVDDRPGSQYNLAAAARLYRLLLGPIEQRMANLDHLIIAPSGPLQSLPFSLLVTRFDGRARRTYEDVDWLIKTHAVSMVPSVQAFHLNRTEGRSRGTSVPFAGFVGGAYGKTEQTAIARRLNLPTSCSDDLSALLDLPPLAGATGEVATIVERVGSDRSRTFRLDDLSEEDVKSLPLGDFRVVHFATHGLFPGELDCLPEPALVVGLPDASGGGDGLLTAAEITNLSINADLVVLSACNTGVVLDQFGGESLASLSRSFFYAGAKGLIVSHWYVSDVATQTLMVGIFDRLKGGVSPVEAVRQAKLAMINDPRTSHPFLWSAFSYLGDGAEAIQL